MTVLLLFFDLIEIGQNLCLDVMLIGSLVDFHDGKLWGKAWLDVVIHLYHVFGGKFGFLDDSYQIFLICKFIFKPDFNRLFNDCASSFPQYPFLSLSLQSFIVSLYNFNCHFHSFWFFLAVFDAISEGEEYSVKKRSLKVIHFDKLFSHYCSLPLPG